MKHQYYSYYPTETYNDNFEKSYQCLNQYSTSHRENNQLSNKDQINNSNQQSNAKTCSYFPTESSTSLISNKTTPSSTLIPPIPQERESWIRSVKKTKMDENSTQKTQYLETMLRMPQPQKSSTNTSTFDRIRFANDRISTTINPIENNNNHNLDVNSFQLINDINNHEDICTIEKILFNNGLQSTTNNFSNRIINSESTVQTNPKASSWSGFLIDNCDDVEVSPISPPSISNVYLTLEEVIQKNQENLNQQNAMLVNELNVADAEQRRELKRQKRFNKKLQKKNQSTKTNIQEQQINQLDSISCINNKIHEELSSDWIVEYDITETDQISQLTDMIKKTSTTMTDENKINQINLILKKIKKQQKELRKLRQHVMSMLDNEQKSNSISTSRQESHTNQDLLMKFLNQPTTSGCWLCSGKTYTEVATQCNNFNE